MTVLVIIGMLLVFAAMGLLTMRSVQNERETDRKRLSAWRKPDRPGPGS